MKIWKWCEQKMKSEYSSYKGDWVQTHQRFCRPGDIVFIEMDDEHHHFKVISMPYKVQDLSGEHNEWTIDLQPIEWKGK